MSTSRYCCSALLRSIRNLAADKAGNVAITFGVLIIPLIGMVGAAIDYSNAYRAKSRIQNALDATSLAVNRAIGTMDEGKLRELARTTFTANLGSGQVADLSTIDISVSEHVVTLKADSKVKTMFMGVVGIDNFDVGASSTTVTGEQTFEIALVLDNSGSMSGSKIRDLTSAAKLLTDTLFAGRSVSDIVSMSVVPFNTAVNVGPQYRTASWIDSEGKSSIANEHFSSPVSRFSLFDNIANADWAGCVEARPHPYDVNDATPTLAKPDTLFVPLFAPDEPDQSGAVNNYLDDGVAGSGRSGRRGRRGESSSADWETAQENVGKYYKGVIANIASANGTHYGPNFGCEANPLTPLSNRKAVIDDALSRMKASGYTNIMEGVAWGWRTLSPTDPFSEGLPYGEKNNTKVIVLMTDGANTFPTTGNENMSIYTAFGFSATGRAGAPSNNRNALQGYMDALTKQACTQAKHEGILIYTVAFQVDDKQTLKMLEHCASKKDMAFLASNGSELIATFDKIAKELSALRIAR